MQAKFLYYGTGEEINFKTFYLSKVPNEPAAMACLVDEKLVDVYSRPKLAVEVSVKKEASRELKFRGIQN